MNVKVQYVVNLEEIPKEVQKLLPVCENYGDRICNLGSLVEEQSFSLAMDEIESIRESMYKVDQRLADCQGILKGYLNVKSRPEERPQEEVPPEQSMEQMVALSESLKQLAERESGAQNDPVS
jgi:hypothetical protein